MRARGEERKADAKTRVRAARQLELRRERLTATGRWAVSAGRTEPERGALSSSLLFVLLVAAAGLSLTSLLLAALPLGTIDRLLAVDAGSRTEQIASFVDAHRLDIAMAGVTMLLGVAAAAVLQTVAG